MFVAGLTLQVQPEQVAQLSDFVWHRASGGLFWWMFSESVFSYFLSMWVWLGLMAFVAAYVIRAVAFGEGFGRRAIASAIMCRLAVSATPMVRGELEVVVIPEERSWRLRHSDAYDNPTVASEIARWLRADSEAAT